MAQVNLLINYNRITGNTFWNYKAKGMKMILLLLWNVMVNLFTLICSMCVIYLTLTNRNMIFTKVPTNKMSMIAILIVSGEIGEMLLVINIWYIIIFRGKNLLDNIKHKTSNRKYDVIITTINITLVFSLALMYSVIYGMFMMLRFNSYILVIINTFYCISLINIKFCLISFWLTRV